MKEEIKQAEISQRIVLPFGKERMEIVVADDCELVNEDGKLFVVRKKPQYPRTYEECCEILSTHSYTHILGHKGDLVWDLQRLLICRDAYWKLAGDWKPDWNNDKVIYHVIATTKGDIGLMSSLYVDNAILCFPTEEMRDAFFENFKDLIEECKELL